MDVEFSDLPPWVQCVLGIILIVTCVSEYLPFTRYQHNGVAHGLLITAQRSLRNVETKQEPEEEKNVDNKKVKNRGSN